MFRVLAFWLILSWGYQILFKVGLCCLLTFLPFPLFFVFFVNRSRLEVYWEALNSENVGSREHRVTRQKKNTNKNTRERLKEKGREGRILTEWLGLGSLFLVLVTLLNDGIPTWIVPVRRQ